MGGVLSSAPAATTSPEDLGNLKVDQRNIFQNEHILLTILDSCELQDFKRFRLVSKQWHDLSLRRWRDEVKVYIYQTNMREDAHTLNEEQLAGLSEPPVLNQPYRSYFLTGIDFSLWPRDFCESNFKRFWTRCGPLMRKIEVVNCRLTCVTVWQIVLSSLPNLEELSLADLYYTALMPTSVGVGTNLSNDFTQHLKLRSLSIRRVGKVSNEASPLPWHSLLSIFPSLQKLHLSEVGKREAKLLSESLVEALEQYSTRQISLSLELRGTDYISPSLKRLTQLPHVKIQSLFFDDWEPSSGDLKDFAQYCTRLSLETCPLRTQTLISLRELSLVRFNPSNWHLIEKTPNLRKLDLLSFAAGWRRISAGFESRLPLVEVFHFGDYLELSGLEIELLIGMMPNVRELRAPLGAESFPIVCKKWAGLRVLHLTHGYMDDDTLTGIASGRSGRLPNLTDLKYLQAVTVDSGKLRDKSVWKGFLQMPEFVHSLTVTLSCKTSDKAFRKLFDRFPFGGVERNEIYYEFDALWPTSRWRLDKRKRLNKELREVAWANSYLPLRKQ